jgi:GTP diphosphokinase / guanosine-3',5'-bis(diphosphate) 3'-diphosphatase
MVAVTDTDAPLSGEVPADVLALEEKIRTYLPESDVARVRRAFLTGARAHQGQTRRSGEPYITHPVAVAHILADLRLDAETLCAAILHDTIEDTALTHDCIVDEFGQSVADLVEGVTKLDKVQFGSRQEADAESFRKMVLAMAKDLRVILIKLSDRLHNMRTLDAMAVDSRRRIARETLDVYAPIAQRLGMNRFKAELQDLGFRSLYPKRHRVIEQRLRAVYGNRRDSVARIEVALSQRLVDEALPARIVSRVKSPYSIFKKMRQEHKSFAQVMDVYGFRVVVSQTMQCYQVLGAVHGLYKPVEGRFKDFIAIPKANGYQSLHTVLFGPGGIPVEIQIRTEDMDTIAERGVAAHWMYKTDSRSATNAQSRAREWLERLVESEQQSGSSVEFLENVKVDLFPDEVYLFTPRGDILSLPRNATVLDFAYAVHTDVGNHAVAARVDKKLAPLRSRLSSGQNVEIITAQSASPNPAWLDWVVTSKARTAIRHFLKRLQHEDAVEMGHRMLDRALDALQSSLDSVPPEVLEQCLSRSGFRRLEELLADIAQGNRVPHQVAQQLLQAQGTRTPDHDGRREEKILISGAERGVLSFAQCCHPLPGDDIMGYLSAGKGIVVHQMSCRNVPEFRKSPERWVSIDWDRHVQGDYRVALRVEVDNKPGVLAQVAAAIADRGSNIENVEYQERDLQLAAILITIEVKDRKHLADVMRALRRSAVVHGLQRANG